MSAADATAFFKDQKDHEVEKWFWSQFSAPKRPLLIREARILGPHVRDGIVVRLFTSAR